MSVEFAGTLFSGSQRNGISRLEGVGHADRYSPISSNELIQAGLFSNIQSVEIITSDEAEGSIILFQYPLIFPNFQGNFLQLSAAAAASGGSGDNWWNFAWSTQSALLVAGNRKGHAETRLSFTTIFQQQWNTFLDKTLGGSRASRQGNPTLTWEMFPVGISHLDPNGTYLKIYQPLHISMPWPIPDYAASMTYHLGLFADANQHLRCWGQRWAYWIEGGLKTGHIEDQLKPQVSSGLGTLVTQVNGQLQTLDALGKVSDVYYLPGNQTADIATGTMTGLTDDDVTIVIEH